MKNKLFTVLIVALLISYGAGYTQIVHAATQEISTPSATPKTTVSADLEALKERLATKVAELRDVVRRAISGTVQSISVSSATIETKTKNMKIELPDDLIITQIINGKRTTLTTDDISKDDPVTIFGTYDTTLDLLKAKILFIESTKVYTHIAGVITDIDRVAYTITVTTNGGSTITVDIEKATKTNTWSKADGITKGGFSKILSGDTVHIVGTTVPKKENQISALRILDIGNLTGEITPTPSATPTIVDSTPSATPKITPKPTIKPTVKPTPKITPTP